LAHIDQTIARFPKASEFRIFKLWALTETKAFEQALLDAQTALEVHPNHPVLLNLLGETQHALGQTDQAMATLLKVLTITPDNIHTAYLLGQIYVAKGQMDQACRYFEGILKYDPKLLNVRLLAMAERMIYDVQQRTSTSS
jgi:tetratricopeptide (TPR) repeat protein